MQPCSSARRSAGFDAWPLLQSRGQCCPIRITYWRLRVPEAASWLPNACNTRDKSTFTESTSLFHLMADQMSGSECQGHHPASHPSPHIQALTSKMAFARLSCQDHVPTKCGWSCALPMTCPPDKRIKTPSPPHCLPLSASTSIQSSLPTRDAGPYIRIQMAPLSHLPAQTTTKLPAICKHFFMLCCLLLSTSCSLLAACCSTSCSFLIIPI